MTAERIDLSALRVGDKVTITFEVTEERGTGSFVALKNGENTVLLSDHTYHGTVERAPRPLEVGDRVRCGIAKATILAIHGGAAWIQLEYGGYGTEFLKNLTREASHA